MQTAKDKIRSMNDELPVLKKEAVELLMRLISIPSISKEEGGTGDVLEKFFRERGIATERKFNNVWAKNKHFDPSLPTILLCSHHDTVKPASGYTRDPFKAEIVDGKLFGLGSNDAGGPLVSLIAAFLYFYDKQGLEYNFIVAPVGEEEISGAHGVESILPDLGKIDFAVVGEPTGMELGITEKGLIVLDCTVLGRSGHAARADGDNAIYKALKDIEWFRTYSFAKISETLGPVKMTVTIIHSGAQHNVIPDKCEFTVDVRTTEMYSNDEVLEEIRKNVSCEVKPRSGRLKSTAISKDHPIVKAGVSLGRGIFGSPTSSDKALMPFPALKLGPGDSSRSHSADEFIYVKEIEEAVELHIKMLSKVACASDNNV
ncbi:MAG TPA: M20 family metallo-hydrolase [Bacteroidia bacterium]